MPLDRAGVAAGAGRRLAAAIPFIASGHVGILGVGLVNDDMASHLLLADWIDERFRPEPVLVDQGYPIGPHALVAGLAALLGTSSINVFAGLTLAIPVLTALVAYGALDGLRPSVRAAASVRRRASLPRRRLPGAGGVQGADHGAVPAGLRAAAGRAGKPGCAGGGAAGRFGGGRHVRLLVPRASPGWAGWRWSGARSSCFAVATASERRAVDAAVR